MKELNLLKDSKAYHEKNTYYEIFSQAEDGEHKVEKYLKNQAKNKIVFDAGCGTGKFLKALESVSNEYIGVDLSFDQIIKAKAKSTKENSIFINANLKNTMLGSNSVDIIISPWVLGTITDLDDRKKCLEELKRILKPSGRILLIENEEGSEFERLRNHDKDLRTKDYKNWIIENGFEIKETFNTYFNFNSEEESKKCFLEIYGKEVANKVNSDKIEHKITIFEYLK